MNISKDWLPTPESINALPKPVREYIHGLETLCDPQYLIQELTLTKDINKQLEAAILTAKADGRAELLQEQTQEIIDRVNEEKEIQEELQLERIRIHKKIKPTNNL